MAKDMLFQEESPVVTLLLAIIYLSFISLGLPDALLGSAWPSMCAQFQVPVSYAGIISFTIAGGTVISSLLSDRLTCRWGTARVTAVSVATTAVALLGFSVTRSYWVLLLWAIPYGLGAGSVDAALNNYVAVHYASLASLFYLGITPGRGVSGFLTIRFDDKTMIRMGQGIILLGVAAMILPLGSFLKMAGLILIGLGCAPIYPCVIHSTPAHFGADNSQAIIGVQMASAYVGTLAMPPIFGLLADRISLGLLPWYLLAITALMIVMCEKLNRVAQTQNG